MSYLRTEDEATYRTRLREALALPDHTFTEQVARIEALMVIVHAAYDEGHEEGYSDATQRRHRRGGNGMTTDNIDASSFGAYLRSLRLYGRGRAGGRTQAEVADAARVSFIDLSKWESHRLPPPDEATLERLATVLDADAATVVRLVMAWQPAPPDPPGWAIACGPSGCRVQRVGE